MEYTKAVECDWCGRIEVSIMPGSFNSWFKRIGWFNLINGNGTQNHFCDSECYEKYKKDIEIEVNILTTPNANSLDKQN